MLSKNHHNKCRVQCEQFWRALCGNSARRDLWGGSRVTGCPTSIVSQRLKFSTVCLPVSWAHPISTWSMVKCTPISAWTISQKKVYTNPNMSDCMPEPWFSVFCFWKVHPTWRVEKSHQRLRKRRGLCDTRYVGPATGRYGNGSCLLARTTTATDRHCRAEKLPAMSN